MNYEKPDYHDAELVLKLYDMRREAVMRQSRHAMAREFWPRSLDDVVALTKPDHPLNAAFRQVVGYWEMAYGFAKHGIINPDFLAENGAEGLLLYAKIKPYVEDFRKEYQPFAFQNAEWLTKNSNVGAERLKWMEGRVASALKARS